MNTATADLDWVVEKRDQIARSLGFLVEECLDGDGPFLTLVAAICKSLEAALYDPETLLELGLFTEGLMRRFLARHSQEEGKKG